MNVVRLSALRTGSLCFPGNITGTRIMSMKHHLESNPRPSGLWRNVSTNCPNACPVHRHHCFATYHTPFLSRNFDILSHATHFCIWISRFSPHEFAEVANSICCDEVHSECGICLQSCMQKEKKTVGKRGSSVGIVTRLLAGIPLSLSWIPGRCKD